MITTKLCPSCHRRKHVSHFSAAPSRPDGLSGWCRSCMSLNTKRYRAKQKESKS